MENTLQILQDLYKNLRDAFVREEKASLSTSKSMYLALLDLKSANKRMSVLLSAAVPFTSLDIRSAEELLKLGYMQYVDQKTNVTLTSSGIWEVENNLKLINHQLLIDFVEKKWFNCFANAHQSLTEKEKVILFSTIAARAFSRDSAVNLKFNEKIHNGWRAIVELVITFLFENKIILSDTQLKESLFKGAKKGTSLHPIIHCFRYSEYLRPKTNGLYIAEKLTYYLNLYKNGEIKQADLVFLFELVFENKLDHKLMDKVYKFCCDVSYNNSVQVFSLDKHIFATPSYDEIVQNALRSLMLQV